MECVICQPFVSRILSSKHFHPYRVYFVQERLSDDINRWVQFSDWFENKRRLQPKLETDMMFSDEACFHLNGIMNKSNCVFWTHEVFYVTID